MDVGYLYSAIHNLHFQDEHRERNIDTMSDLITIAEIVLTGIALLAMMRDSYKRS